MIVLNGDVSQSDEILDEDLAELDEDAGEEDAGDEGDGSQEDMQDCHGTCPGCCDGDVQIDIQPCDSASDEGDSGDDDILSEISFAERECQLAESAMVKCKAELKSAKAEFDECVLYLRELVRSLAADRERPLMPAFEKAEKCPAQPGGDEAQEPTPYQDAWRKAKIEELALPAGLLNKLVEAGIETIGQLEDLRAEIAIGRESWPKGIGVAKITIIEDRVLDWLKDNQDRQDQVTDDQDDFEEEDGEEAED